MQHGQYTRTEGGEAGGVYGRFFMEEVQDPVATAEQGRPIFREVERVEIVIPGNQWLQPVHPVNDEHRQRFAKEYEAFRQGREAVLDGTPIEEWPILNRAQIAELKYLGFRRVEDIAAAADTIVQRIGMGGYGLREKAKAWLDEAAEAALTEKLSSENNQLRAEISNLQRQVNEMGELLRQTHAEMIAKKNEAHPFLTALTPQIEAMPQISENAGSSLAGFEATRRRPGRPRKDAEAAA